MMTNELGRVLATALGISVAVAAPTACKSNAADAGGFDEKQDCSGGFPEEGDPCVHEGAQCVEETPGPCDGVATYTCRNGHLVASGVRPPPPSCTSACSGHQTGDLCQQGSTCTPTGGVTCACFSSAWACSGALDAGADAADAASDGDARVDATAAVTDAEADGG